MKVYVDELPKGCYCCAFNDENVVYGNSCLFGDNEKTCPLQSLAEHDKQVRKEVYEIFKEAINECRREYYQEFLMHSNPIRERYYRGYDFIRARKLEEILDQIQGE